MGLGASNFRTGGCEFVPVFVVFISLGSNLVTKKRRRIVKEEINGEKDGVSGEREKIVWG